MRDSIGGGDVAIGETHAFRCQTIEVRGFHILLGAHGGEVGVTVVIGEDDDHVRRAFGRRGERNSYQGEESGEKFHSVTGCCSIMMKFWVSS